MTIKLSDDFKTARQEFLNSVQNGEAPEVQNEKYEGMINELFEETKKQAKQSAESVINLSSSDKRLTAEQRQFFNEINKEVGYKEETLLPQETIDRIFEDLTTQHPFLEAIGLKNAGLRMKFLKSETSGTAVWGKIYGEIKGQLEAKFTDEEAIQNKLTAFVVIPKDLKDFGPSWIELFVRTQIEEAFAVALELAFLTGDGKEQPIGLNRKVAKGVSVTDGKYPEKTSIGTLTLADETATVKELANIFDYHSTDEKDRPVLVEGNVKLVVNPTDSWALRSKYTVLNANGVYVTALPFNLQLIESVAQKAGEVLSFVSGRYDAYVAGGINIQKFEQTFAMEDLDLYTAKQFAYGKAKDDKVAAIWKLDMNGYKSWRETAKAAKGQDNQEESL